MQSRTKSSLELTLGVDFGTSFTRVTVFDPRTGEALRLPLSAREAGFRRFAVPSVAVRYEKRWAFGYEAERVLQDAQTASLGEVPVPFRSLKRILGRGGDGEKTFRETSGEEITSIIARFLKYVLNQAEPVLQNYFPSATITALPMNLSVPVWFDHNAREKLSTVYADVFGNDFDRKMVVNEPTAAGMAVHGSPSRFPEGTTAIFDVGAGTTDVTLLNKIGDHLLVVDSQAAGVGGDDIDEILSAMVAAKLRAKRVNLSDPVVSRLWQLERPRVTRLKEALSAVPVATELFPFGGLTVPVECSVAELEGQTRGTIQKMVEVLKVCLDRGGRKLEGTTRPLILKKVIVVGGSSYVPLLRRELRGAVDSWRGRNNQRGGEQIVQHVTTLPGAPEDGALFAVALGTAYPASRFQEVSLGQVPYDVRLVLGDEKPKHLNVFRAYEPLPAASQPITIKTNEFYPFTARLEFLHAGELRSQLPLRLDIRGDPGIDVELSFSFSLNEEATVKISHGIVGGRQPERHIEHRMPWIELMARRLPDFSRYYKRGGVWDATDRMRGGFYSEGHGDDNPG